MAVKTFRGFSLEGLEEEVNEWMNANRPVNVVRSHFKLEDHEYILVLTARWATRNDGAKSRKDEQEGHLKIYLAASYSRREEMMGYAEQLRADGYEVTARWITGMHDDPSISETVCAEDDVNDIYEADCMISFTEVPANGRHRGGRHVEFGIALALEQTLIIVGPRENVFHHLPNVSQFDTFDAVRAALRGFRHTGSA